MIRDEIRNIKSAPRDLSNFGLVVGGVLLAMAALLWWKGRPAAPYVGGVGGALALFGLIAPGVLKPLQKPWMVLAVLMGWVMTRVILSALFYIGFGMIGLIARIFGKRFLTRKLQGDSYWQRREGAETRPDDMDRQF